MPMKDANMSRPAFHRYFAVALGFAATLAVAGESAQGVYIRDSGPGKWRNGTLVWKYNAAGRPANITDQQALNAINQGFAAWSAACNITAQYGGTSSGSLTDTSSNEIVVGFADLGTQIAADASPYSNDNGSGGALFTGGHIRLNTNAGVSLSTSLADGRVLTHEIGHLLGFDHSDDPLSIMFADPYNAFTALTGDDIETCANLYGGKGVQTLADYSTAAADASLGLSGEIDVVEPKAGANGSTTGTVTIGVPAYFYLQWQGITANSSLAFRFVAPNGMTYESVSTTAGGSGFAYLGLADQIALPYNGNWLFQGVVNGKVGVSLPFLVQGAKLNAAVAKLEYAAIVEQGSNGSISSRTVDYSPVALSNANAYLNGAYAAKVSSFAAPTGNNQLEFWAKSATPRYPLDLSNNIGGQSATSADSVRQVLFSASGGALSGNGITTSETGSQMAYSARANIQASSGGSQGVYVAALLGGQLYFRHSNGWDLNATPLFSFTAPGAANFDVLRGFDTRIIPAGTALFVGYGATLNDVVTKNQYTVVHAF
jgi:hypothetical protein